MALNLVFLGPPGAGKGTIAQRVSEKLGIPHIATGDLLRKEVALKTGIGKRAESVMAKGDLVDDDTITQLLASRLEAKDTVKGFILDGYPRTVHQIELLDDIFKKTKDPLNAVIYIRASDETIIKRLSNRRQCRKCGKIYNLVSLLPKEAGKCDACSGELFQREDDMPDTIKKRLDVYNERTAPIVACYRDRGLLKEVDCDGTLQECIKNVYSALETVK